MAITAMGLGTKQAPENVNLDPQRQFWSWMQFLQNPDETGDSSHHVRGYISGFNTTQTSPAGMSVQIGGASTIDSAILWYPDPATGKTMPVLLSTDGEPQVVNIPTAPASGSRIDTIVSYIDLSDADAETETPGTPEYVHTVVVSGTASSSPSAPTDSQIVAALPAGANSRYYAWAQVRVATSQTIITNSNITSLNPTSPNVYLTTSDIQSIADQRIAVTDDFYQTTTSTVTPWNGVSLRITKWPRLRLAQAQLSGRYNNPQNTANSPAVVPAAYRPASESRTVGFIAGNCCTMSLNTDGTVFYWMKSGTGVSSEFNGNFVYKTAN